MMCCLFVTLWLTLAQGTPIAENFANLRGLPIAEVQIEAPIGYQTQTLFHLIDIAPGYLFEDEAIRSAIKRLYAIGSFSQVEVQAQRQQGVVYVTFVLHPQKKLERIDIYQLHQADETRLRQALAIGRDGAVSTQTASQLTERALAELQRQGFYHAAVQTVRRGTEDPDRWSFDMIIRESTRTKLGSISWCQNSGISAAVQQQLLFVQPNDPFDSVRLNQQQQAIERAYLRHGFRQAKITLAIDRQQLQANVRICVEPGPRIQFRFHGDNVLTKEQLLALWPEPSGAWLSGSLPLWRQNIINHYIEQGYPFIHVQLQEHSNPQANEHLVDVLLHEGPAVAVTSIRFTNAHALPSALLAEQIQQLLVQQIPQTELLSPIDGRELSLHGSAILPLPPSYAQAPVEQRWVPAIYRQAIAQIKAFYEDLGFQAVRVDYPQLMPLLTEQEQEIHPRCVADAATSSHLCAHEVTIAVEEGPQWFIHSLGFRGSTHLSNTTLLELVAQGNNAAAPSTEPSEHSATDLLSIAPGSPYSATALEDGRIAILSRLRDDGYAYAQVELSAVELPNSHFVDVTYSITPGEQVIINTIVVQGQVHTQDSVLSHRISLATNQPYLRAQAIETQRNLLRLGVFANVQIQLLEENRPEQRKDVLIRLQEQDRMKFAIAPGVSSAEGPRLNLSFTHLHLFGTATALTLSGRLNRPLFFQLLDRNTAAEMEQRFAAYNLEQQISRAIERELRAELRLPPLMQLPLQPLTRFFLVHSRINQAPFELTRNSLNFSIDTQWGQHVQCALESSLEQYFVDTLLDRTRRLADGTILQLPSSEGTSISARIGPWLRLDWRDHPLHPSKGFWFSGRITAVLAWQQPNATAQNPLPNTTFVPFLRYETTLAAYQPLGPLVYAITLRSGLLQISGSQQETEQQAILAPERFFIGGPDTLRGIAQNTLITADSCTLGAQTASCRQVLPNDKRITNGGTFFAIVKNELRIPLVKPLWFSLFVDVGNLWFAWPIATPLQLRTTGGVGLRFVTPVGTIAFEIGINPWPRSDLSEPGTQLHFSIGPT